MLSGEHIFSDWMNRVLGYRKYNITKTDSLHGDFKPWAAKSLNLKAKVVCEDCNSGWMSELENNLALPVLGSMLNKAYPFCLMPSGTAALSCFAFKGAVVCDHLEIGRRKPFYSPSARNRFKLSLDIPPGIQIWLSTLNTRVLRVLWRTDYYEPPPGPMRGLEIYVLTYIVGYVVIQVSSVRAVNRVKHKRMGRLIQDPAMKDICYQIWPSLGTVINWPTPGHLRDDMIEEFCGRWKSLTVYGKPHSR